MMQPCRVIRTQHSGTFILGLALASLGCGLLAWFLTLRMGTSAWLGHALLVLGVLVGAVASRQGRGVLAIPCFLLGLGLLFGAGRGWIPLVVLTSLLVVWGQLAARPLQAGIALIMLLLVARGVQAQGWIPGLGAWVLLFEALGTAHGRRGAPVPGSPVDRKQRWRRYPGVALCAAAGGVTGLLLVGLTRTVPEARIPGVAAGALVSYALCHRALARRVASLATVAHVGGALLLLWLLLTEERTQAHLSWCFGVTPLASSQWLVVPTVALCFCWVLSAAVLCAGRWSTRRPTPELQLPALEPTS
jgi:hypothetical protein